MKQKFKIVPGYDDWSQEITIVGPNSIVATISINPAERSRSILSAEKMVLVLNEHWDSD